MSETLLLDLDSVYGVRLEDRNVVLMGSVQHYIECESPEEARAMYETIFATWSTRAMWPLMKAAAATAITHIVINYLAGRVIQKIHRG